MKYIRNWFSNFEPFETPMPFNGLIFKTPEHFYQAMKSESYDGQLAISQLGSASDAKRLGRRLLLRPDWEDIKYSVMLRAQIYRFSSSKNWQQKLMETTGEIVEVNNWHDNEWGDCICTKCSGIPSRNLLGKSLMWVRDVYLRDGAKLA